MEPLYYADRAGRIAASQFPILTALGMRNNFISCSSRKFRIKLYVLDFLFLRAHGHQLRKGDSFDYQKITFCTVYLQLNYLHRLLARVLCILLWVHGAGHVSCLYKYISQTLIGIEPFQLDHYWVSPLLFSFFSPVLLIMNDFSG